MNHPDQGPPLPCMEYCAALSHPQPGDNNNNNNNSNNNNNNNNNHGQAYQKFKDFEIKVERMWGLKTTTVLEVMGALGTIKKKMENYTNKIADNINIHELQKITLLSTAHLLRRVLSIK